MRTLISTKALADYQILNPLGETLGSITDVVLDADLRHARYLVLSFGGVLGMGDKLFAMPMNAVHLDTENECLILDVKQQQLKDAPGFDKHHWPSAADPELEAAVYRFDHPSAPRRK